MTKNYIVQKITIAFLLIFSLNGFSQQNELTWHTDVNQAVEFSVKQEKPMIMFFTGSDWCGWCKKLVKEVFVTSEFATLMAERDAEDRAASELSAEINGLLIDYFARKIQ